MRNLITYKFNPWNFSSFKRKGGHLYITIGLFLLHTKVSEIVLIVDSGAYITVLSRGTAERMELPLTGVHTANLNGFNTERGSDKAEIVTVPKISIGKYLVEDVQILVPLENIPIAEVIGENVLEYFNYMVDHENNKIYFSENPKPKPYKNPEKGIDLSCGKVLLLSENESNNSERPDESLAGTGNIFGYR